MMYVLCSKMLLAMASWKSHCGPATHSAVPPKPADISLQRPTPDHFKAIKKINTLAPMKNGINWHVYACITSIIQATYKPMRLVIGT